MLTYGSVAKRLKQGHRIRIEDTPFEGIVDVVTLLHQGRLADDESRFNWSRIENFC